MFFTKKKFLPLSLSNTLSNNVESFAPQHPPTVTLYSCGPTVYGPQHIGNLRSAVFSDLLARALAYAGYRVKRVINITDVGHLVGDGDEGEDKMVVGARRENISPMEVAKRYTDQYLRDIRALNVDTRLIRFPRATDYIQDQIRMIQTLEKRGHTYTLPDGVYFDVSTFPSYGKLGGRDKAELLAGARVDVVAGKKHPQDFVLWRKAKPQDLQQWKSPWGMGNPGWSIECSAMIRALLGETIDIHTGGEDHISVHHNNEIAQSEGSSGKPLARIWMHNAFLTINGEKISKSLGNIFTLEDIMKRNIHPLALRYLFLQAHYRSPLSFTWESLEGAHEALIKLWLSSYDLIKKHPRAKASDAEHAFVSSVLNDLKTPQALGTLWEHMGRLPSEEAFSLLQSADQLFGLSLLAPPIGVRTEDKKMAQEREEARSRKDFTRSDEIRIHMENRGYRVYDRANETIYIDTTR